MILTTRGSRPGRVTCNRVRGPDRAPLALSLSLSLSPSPYLLLFPRVNFPLPLFYFLLFSSSLPSWLAHNRSSRHNRPILSVNLLRYVMCAFFFDFQSHGVSNVSVSYFCYTRQLRDLIICPDERGVVNYVQDQCIMERDMTDPSSVSPFPFHLPFCPRSFFFLLCLCVPMRATKESKERK